MAALEFLRWLRSPDGALAWPYIWRDEYRQTMIDITYHMMNIVHKIIILSALKGAGGKSQ
jgi:hypothetical protein